jgi:hypothetical protein
MAGSRSLTSRITVIPNTPAEQGVEGSYVRHHLWAYSYKNSTHESATSVPALFAISSAWRSTFFISPSR